MSTTLRAVAAALTVAVAGPAFAQTAPAQTAAPAAVRPTNPGPVIPGVCVLDEQRAIVTSAAGRAYNTRMTALTQQVEAELRPQRTTIETEANTLNGQLATLTPEVRQQRTQALQTRANTYETLARTRQAELQATQERQLRRIATEMQPVVAQVYVQRTCGLLIDKSGVAYSNPAMEVTDAVIAGLNTRLPTLTFERERAPAQTGAATPARPATTPPTRR
jgi:outer membrane protein